MKTSRVAYFTNIPTPYKTGMLNAMGRVIPGLKVYYLAEVDHLRHWKDVLASASHPHAFLKSWRVVLRKLENEQYLSATPFRLCFGRRVDCAVFAPYSQVSFLLAIAACKLRGVRLVIWYESHDSSSIAPSIMGRIGRWVKRQLFLRADAVVVPGRLAKSSAMRLGVLLDRIHVAPHSVDLDVFAIRSQQEAVTDRVREVAKTAARYRRVLLYVGQSVPRKNLGMVVDVFRRAGLEDTCLLLVGVGSAMPSEGAVHVVPYLQREELAQVFNVATGLVLASKHEVWGLVVNEALASGMPVLVSNACGASEMVIEGENGFLFDPNNHSDFERALLAWARVPAYDRQAIRATISGRYNFDRMATAFGEAVAAR